MMKRYFLMLFIFTITGCASIPDGIQPVSGFELNRYLGKWYEVARLENTFEKDLNNITAEYTLRDEGSVKVVNRGYNEKKNKWQQAEGHAKFIGSSSVGKLKVFFFGPFYGGYNIFELDKNNYQYAMIAGNDMSYFWLLSRTPILKPEVKKQLIKKAREQGFTTESLIYVLHNKRT